MLNPKLLNRISHNPRIMSGRPVVNNTHVTVECVLGLLAQGLCPMEILDEYDNISEEDISACLLFAITNLQQTYVGDLKKAS